MITPAGVQKAGPVRLVESREEIDFLRGINRAQEYLFQIQKPDGHWCAELEGDTILESEYILTLFFIGRLSDHRIQKAADSIRQSQLPEGGWATFQGGPPEVSQSAKAYFVLKLAGDSPDAPHMQRAREVICHLGGLDACNSFTRIYFAVFGQYPWEKCPAVPPELILLPKWFPINIYEMSSWSRAIVVPLSVIWAQKAHCPVPENTGIKELWLHRPTNCSMQRGFWAAFFRKVDWCLRFGEHYKLWSFWRQRALTACEKWMTEHFKNSDGIGAIFPPIINSIIALRCLGYDNEHPLTKSQICELEKLEIERDNSFKIAPCFSPVWDTAISFSALVESGISPQHPQLLKSAKWLMKKEVRIEGDWKVKNPAGNPGGWFFEYSNPLFPDIDDTAQVLTSLSQFQFPDRKRNQDLRGTLHRALEWTLSMQNKDGGWASFDKDCDMQLLVKVPFADHNAMIDPSTADITGRVLESLSKMGLTRESGEVRRAIRFILKEQGIDGPWFGRWGCNYLYGTWLVLRGLSCIGEDMRQPYIQRAVAWLKSVQNPDGGWGESMASYEDPTWKGKGVSAPSQTAWALMGLLAAGESQSDVINRGFQFLIQQQKEDGSWEDQAWTGTGFPRVFYLKYHLYATYFPLMALGIYQQQRIAKGKNGD
jgi:squalene-hopene/tetraprenyl-beta-curcumene cyclase